MKKLGTLFFGILLLFPSLSFAQTLTDAQKQQLLVVLYQELAQLEQQINILILQEQATQIVPQVIQAPKPSAASLQIAQQTQYTQNCINAGVKNYEAQGLDASQAYTKAIINCP